MRYWIVMLAAAGLVLAACGNAGGTPARAVKLQPCDDGGSGGVIIDGVCL